jgi:ParB family chromosome partitioning protein
MTRKALGRGLGALIPGAPSPGATGTALGDPHADAPVDDFEDGAADGSPSPEGSRPSAPAPPVDDRMLVQDIPLTSIVPNPKQPRVEFDPQALEELAESIRAQGVLQPVLVRPAGEGFQLVAGERRFRAAERLGLQTIPAIVRELDDDQLLEVALIENLQREDLNPIEEAFGYQHLIEELTYTHDRLSERLGKSRTTITNALRLLTLPATVQTMVSRGTLSAGHARALLGLPSHAEVEAGARYVIEMALSVRKTEALVARKLRRKTTARRPRGARTNSQVPVDAVSSAYGEWTDRLRRHFATQVRIVPQGDHGVIEIEYYGEQDLERLLETMGVMT